MRIAGTTNKNLKKRSQECDVTNSNDPDSDLTLNSIGQVESGSSQETRPITEAKKTAAASEPEAQPPQHSNEEIIASKIPQRRHKPDIEPYTAHKDASDRRFIQRSEATYVPKEPKVYVSPDSSEENHQETEDQKIPINTQRLFITIELPRELKREFADLARSFRPREYERVRWIDEDGMHLTLKFLGDTAIEQIPDIMNSLQNAAESTGKFSIKIGRTGCFPSFRDPRICWVGFTGELRRLEQLQGRVEGAMVALGLEPGERVFKAHVTIGRTRPGIRGRFAEDIGVSWQHAPIHSTGKVIPIKSIALYRSYLNDKKGTLYQQLGNYELG